MKISVGLLLLVLLTPAEAAVYKWVDDQGVIHYSDQPSPGAETVSVPEDRPRPRVQKPAAADPRQTDAPVAAGYQIFRIIGPTQNQTIRSNQGRVALAFELQPVLERGHIIRLYVDGLKIKDEFTSTEIALQDLERGSHSLRAVVVDAGERTLISTDTVHFHLRRETDDVQDHIAPPADNEKAFQPTFPKTPDGSFPETPEGDFPGVPEGEFPGVPQGKGLYPSTPGGEYKPAFKPNYQQKP